MIDAIAKQFVQLGYIDKNIVGIRDLPHMKALDSEMLTKQAESVALKREYPASLANRNVSEPRV